MSPCGGSATSSCDLRSSSTPVTAPPVTSTPGTRPRDHGIPTFDYLVDQSSRRLGVAVRVMPRSSDPRCTWLTIVFDRGTREGAAGPDSPEIYRGCGWAPDTLAPAHFVGPLGQTRLGCSSL